MMLACSARKTLKINRNLPNIEGLQPTKIMKAQTRSHSLLICYPSRFVVSSARKTLKINRNHSKY
jgi:hypothetical protein